MRNRKKGSTPGEFQSNNVVKKKLVAREDRKGLV